MSSTTAEGDTSTPDTSFAATEATTAMTSPSGSPLTSPTLDRPMLGDSASELSALRLELEAATEACSKAENRAHVLEAELSRFKDQHAFVAAAKEALEKQLREEMTKREAAEEKVEILRGQVESARRGVMQLQKQEQDRAAHRVSRQLDGGADDDAAEARKAKRSSMYGLGLSTKSARPVSTISNGDAAEPPIPIPAKSGLRELRLGSNPAGNKASMSLKVMPSSPGLPTSPRTPKCTPGMPKSPVQALSPTRRTGAVEEETSDEGSPVLGEGLKPPSRRASAVSGTSVSAVSFASAISGDAGEHLEKLKAARMETEVLKTQVEALEVKLMEADEARQASEECLKALREFMAADPNSTDGDAASLRGISLPPLPTDRDHDEPAPPPEAKAGWGFNMWRRESVSQPGAVSPIAQSVPLSPPVPPAPTSPSIVMSPPINEVNLQSPDPSKEEKPVAAGFFSSWTKTAPPPPPEPEPEVEAEVAGANLGRKMTSFFGRRARMGSRAAQKAAEEKAEREEVQALPEEDDAPHAAAVAAAMGEVRVPSIDSEVRPEVAEVKPEAAPIPVPELPEDIAELAETPAEAPVPSPIPPIVAPHESPEPRLAYLDDDEPKDLAPPKPKRSASRNTSPSPQTTPLPARTSSRGSLDMEPRVSLDSPRVSLDTPLKITPVRRGSLPSAVSPLLRSPHSPLASPGMSSPGTPVRAGSTGPAEIDPDEVEEVQSETEETDETEGSKPARPQRRNASRRGRGGAKVTKKNRGGFV